MMNGELGGETVVSTRNMGLLIWQWIKPSLVYSFLLFSPFTYPNNSMGLASSVGAFLVYLLTLFGIRRALDIFSPIEYSLFMYLVSLSILLSLSFPLSLYFALDHPLYSISSLVVSPFDKSNVPTLFISARNGKPLPLHVRLYMSSAVFVTVAGVSTSVGLLLLCGFSDFRVFIKGFATGVVYALHYLYNRRWVLRFPILQRPPFSSFKLEIPVAALRALRLCVVAYVLSAVLALFIPNESEAPATTGQFISEQITFFTGNFVIFLCYELNHHLHQVLHTKRVVFAPPEGSEAAKTNPSEPLLAALEESRPRSLIRYLAYLDLCMVCENNVDTWRRAALFEETGKTYKRIMIACLKPLEKLIWDLTEGLKTNDSADKSFYLINQLKPPTDLQSESRIYEAFYDFQLCAWCARIAASLIVRVHKEGRLGVSRLDSYADVMSALLSCLLAIEAFMRKETDLQLSQLAHPANINWDTRISGRREVVASGVILKKRGTLYSKAYSMSDTLRTSIYCIVSAFHTEMTTGDIRLLDMTWVTNKPLFGTREILLQKLCLFLEFRAN